MTLPRNKMPYIVCCPTSFGEGTHMSFSRVYDSAANATAHRERLRACTDVTAPFKGAWGPRSMLYELQHELYNNDRPPHVAGGLECDVTIYLSQAYVKEIKSKAHINKLCEPC